MDVAGMMGGCDAFHCLKNRRANDHQFVMRVETIQNGAATEWGWGQAHRIQTKDDIDPPPDVNLTLGALRYRVHVRNHF
jgi:hypothetical protein